MQQSLPESHQQPVNWLVFCGSGVVTPRQRLGFIQASWAELHHWHAYAHQVHLLETEPGRQLFVLDLGEEQPEHEIFEIASLRELLMQQGQDDFPLLAKAWQNIHFLRTHRFCGRCGSAMRRSRFELAMQCDRCRHRCYPRISPCIIVAVRKGDKILLAQGKAQQARGMHSTLAGFVESGETLEQAVHREVMEEVGIRIKNLRYFSSQPWPFPHSLMVGFLAEHAEGEIQVDGKEILTADWFAADELPYTPPTFSIAGQLIERALAEVATGE